MPNDTRLDPDELLRVINQETSATNTGKLRVFLGMSAGVGKTYAMLKAAHQKKHEGCHVVIGLVETHGRIETANLLDGLEIIPRKLIKHRDRDLEEMDLERILALKPELVIVDELPHTNIPGSRHEKRYQDVIEILDAGIDVYTAINVQHLESRKDVVETITGIKIRESVPDSILERANMVELVDIAPSELIKRLKGGKVYLGDKANEAADKFFKEDKLTALREVALRMTAERVDQDLQRFTVTRDETPWQTNERLLVAVSHSPYSEKLIRATRRLAYNLEAPWIAVHIDTGVQLNDEDQSQLIKNLNLARELSAEVITTTDTDLPNALKRIARQKNVTQVIVGRPTRRWFRDFLEGGSLLDRLVLESLEVDIHIIRMDNLIHKRPTLLSELSLYRTKTGFFKYYNTIWFLLAVTLLSFALESFIGYRAIGFIFLLGVLGVGMFGSIGAVLFSALGSALIWNICFIPPKYTFLISQPDDIILCISYFVVAITSGLLTNRIRFHEKLMYDRQEKTDVLYESLKDIANYENKKELINKVKDRIGKLLDGDCEVILKGKDGSLDFNLNKNYSLKLDDKERAVASWTFQNQKVAGWSTDTLMQAKSLYLPLKGINENIGVFVFRPIKTSRKFAPDQEGLLYSITGQLGVSLERDFLSQRISETQRLEDSEKLHQTILSSISHELRTPLTVILGAAASLDSELIKDPNVKTLAESIAINGERLNRVIENLLDMSRLSNGSLALKLEWNDLSDIIGVVTRKLLKPLSKHKLIVKIAPEFQLIRTDFRLFEHALSNLILNSTQYSDPDTSIYIEAYRQNNRLIIVIKDEGPGIPIDSQEHIFEKFYRVPGSPPGGTGLGLSIVQNIIELHKGILRYENNIPTGSRFIIDLPYEKQPEIPEDFLR
jgi:two-component system sensor histidine kinase KdpD